MVDFLLSIVVFVLHIVLFLMPVSATMKFVGVAVTGILLNIPYYVIDS